MALHPAAAQLINELSTYLDADVDMLSVEQVRKLAQLLLPYQGAALDMAAVHDLEVNAATNRVPVRVYTPNDVVRSSTIVFVHGGGWVAADLDLVDVICRALSHESRRVVVSVDYRRSPEHPFPAALLDCYAVARWCANGMQDHPGVRINVHDSIVLVGEGAGGNLAAATALMARERKEFPVLGQALICAPLDCSFTTPSYSAFADGYVLTRDVMRWYWSQYVPNDEARREPLASPLRADALSGLPPALIVTAEYDPLRDEAEEYARRLRHSGCNVHLSRYDGMIHGFLQMRGRLTAADELLAELAAWCDLLDRRGRRPRLQRAHDGLDAAVKAIERDVLGPAVRKSA